MCRELTKWQWREDTVDCTDDFAELRFAQTPESVWDACLPVCLVGKPQDQVFPVHFLLSSTHPLYGESTSRAKRELDFYLSEKQESDPWSYVRHHCGTAANMHSDIHWSFFPKGWKRPRDRGARRMPDWRGREIAVAHSKGGVLVTTNPLDNLVLPDNRPAPAPEILQKLYKSRQERAFAGEDRVACEAGLGYYCDLQSIHSEDAITWSVFGTVGSSGHSIVEAWVGDLFALLDLEGASPEQAEIYLWRRIPHPDILVPGGPEIDFGIMTRNTVLLGEAKWLSAVGAAQGKDRNKDQIQLRGEFLSKFGARLFPTRDVHVVVAVGLLPDAFQNTAPPDVIFREMTWDRICAIPSHPYVDEVWKYYLWKRLNARADSDRAKRIQQNQQNRDSGHS